MSDKNDYIVLARKYRPKKLREIIGQDEICKVIEGSIKLHRIAHAFLFSGTRGVGKTTLARILAKIVNCSELNQDVVEPCGKCKNCQSIDLDNNMDVVEIDAASRTGVSDVREIIDNVNYKPVAAKKKIFIIDEVHMLSKAAFNALLKTLEEPPRDVIFIFATTETEKIPLTILSRCQKFQLKRVDMEIISRFLFEISQKEGFEIDTECCDTIAQASEGSVRDALSILDNVLTRGNPIKIEVVRSVLGLSDTSQVLSLFQCIFEGDVKASLEIFENLYIQGVSIQMLSQMLMKLAYHSMRLKIEIDSESSVIDSKSLELIKRINEKFEMDFIVRFWELMQKYMNEINRCFDEKQFFEVIIMRLCYVSLTPTPFEFLKKSNLDIVKEEKTKKTDKTIISKEGATHSQSFQKQADKTFTFEKGEENNSCSSGKDPKSWGFENMVKFKYLVDMIEKKSEMLISFHLKNSFKLVSLVDNTNVKEIELEKISDNNDSKKILWKASKLLNEITNERWMISLSRKKGLKTLSQFESDIKQEEMNKIKNKTFIKKILETIPSSEVISINDLENLQTLKKRDYNE